MALSKKIILREIRDVILLAVSGIVMTWAGLTCKNCYDSIRGFWIVSSFTALVWIFLWKGNSYLAEYISSKISWIQYPIKRFIIGLVVTIAYTISAMFFLGTIYRSLFGFDAREGAFVSVVITIIISLFFHGRAFLINWKQATIDTERLKQENISARYESLKNQVNPHFLFNSLNALTNLVYEDQDKAVKFIKQLSEVYRYVLDTRDKEVVSLETELAFLNSYLYLQQIRFGNKLHVDVNINDKNVFVAPLALQMLIENAIKHNVVSQDDPLIVSIFTEDNFIVVRNNLQIKSRLSEHSAGVGLENIRKRYEFLSETSVSIEQTGSHFTVKLPLVHNRES